MKKVIGILSILGMSICSQSIMALCLGCSCSVNSNSVAFGTYNPIANVPSNTVGTITVTCQALISLLDAPYTISLSKGNGPAFNDRRMSAPNDPNALKYNLYTSPARTQIWGNGTGSTSSVSGQIAFLRLLQAVTINHTIYGNIPANQAAVKAGNYSDNINITISY